MSLTPADFDDADDDADVEPAFPDDGSWSLTGALGYGWAGFVEEWPRYVLASLTVVLAGGLAWLGYDIASSLLGDRPLCDESGACDGGESWTFLNLRTGIGVFLFLFVSQVVAAPIVRGALDSTQGWRFVPLETLTRLFWDDVLLTALLTSLVVGVATVFWIVPGLVAAAMLMYAMFVTVDTSLGPWEAVKGSARIALLAPFATLSWFVVGAVFFVGGLLFAGLGALVALPVVLVGTAWTYRVLTGHAAAPKES